MTDLRDKVPVEPPSEARWERLERKLFEARDRELRESGMDLLPSAPLAPSRRTARSAAAAIHDARQASTRRMLTMSGVTFAFAAAAAVLVFFLVRSTGTIAVNGGGAAPVRIVTPAGGSSRVELGDAILEVGADTAIEARVGAGGAVTIDLMRGRVGCDVTPRLGRPPFAVVAGDVEVSVVGTAFSVDRGASVTVQVTRGRVAVRTRGGEPIALVAGDAWSSTAGRVAAATETPAGPASASAVRAEPPGPATAQNADSAPAAARSAAPGSAAPGPAAPGPAAPGPAAPVAVARAAAGAGSGSPQAYQGSLEEAAKLEKTDLPKAIAMYRKLSAVGKDPVAEKSMLRLAELRHGGKGGAKEVIELAERFERRFPRSPHLLDMLSMRATAHFRLNEISAAHSVVRRYLAKGGERSRLDDLKISP